MPVQGVGATYKPLSASDVFGAQNAMMQYKLGQMKMKDYEKKVGHQANIENILSQSACHSAIIKNIKRKMITAANINFCNEDFSI